MKTFVAVIICVLLTALITTIVVGTIIFNKLDDAINELADYYLAESKKTKDQELSALLLGISVGCCKSAIYFYGGCDDKSVLQYDREKKILYKRKTHGLERDEVYGSNGGSDL